MGEHMVKGIIFDFDGTLVDTEEVAYQAVKQYLRDTYQVTYTRRDYQKSIGSADGVFYQHLEKSLGKPVNVEAIEACFTQAQKTKYPEVPLREGIAEVIQYGKKNQLKLAIVSNSRKAELMHFFAHHQELMSVFDLILTRDDVKEGKPAPEGYQKCLAQLALSEEEVIALEDSPTGVTAALSAGLKVLAYPNAFTTGMVFPEEAMVVAAADLAARRFI